MARDHDSHTVDLDQAVRCQHCFRMTYGYQGTMSYSQNMQTLLFPLGYGPAIPYAQACLPLHNSSILHGMWVDWAEEALRVGWRELLIRGAPRRLRVSAVSASHRTHSPHAPAASPMRRQGWLAHWK